MCSYIRSYFELKNRPNENNTSSQLIKSLTDLTETPQNSKKIALKSIKASSVHTSNNLATDEHFHTPFLNSRYKIPHGIKEEKAQSFIKEKSGKNNRKRKLSLSPLLDASDQKQNGFLSSSDDFKLTQYSKLLEEKCLQKRKKIKLSQDSKIKQNLANRYKKEHNGFENSSNDVKTLMIKNILNNSLNEMFKSSDKKNKLLAKYNIQNCEHPKSIKINKIMQSFSSQSCTTSGSIVPVERQYQSGAVKLSERHKLLPEGHMKNLSDVFAQECKRCENNSKTSVSDKGILHARKNEKKSTKRNPSIPDVSQSCKNEKPVPRNQAVRIPVSSLFNGQKHVSLKNNSDILRKSTTGKVDDFRLTKKRRKHNPNILAATSRSGKSAMSENASSQNATKSNESFQQFLDNSISDSQFTDYSSDEELNFDLLLGKAEEEFKLTEYEISALKNLYIKVTWEIPLLHKLPNGVKATLRLLDNTDSVVEGYFLEEESAIILSNWKKFMELYNFTRPLPFIENSGRKCGILSGEERLKFYQFLGKGLPNRILSSISAHFQEMFGEFKKGKFTTEEDKLITVAAKYHRKQMYSLLSKLLRRSRTKIYRRHQLLKKQGLMNSVFPLTSETIQKIVVSLVTTTGVHNIEELRHTVIAKPIWRKVSEMVSIPPVTLNRIWLHKLYTYFFATSTVYKKKISVELINWLYHESEATQWNRVNWKTASVCLHDVGPLFLYFKKHHLVDHYVPLNIKKNFKECVAYLHDIVLPKLEASAVNDVPLMRLILQPNMTVSQL